MSIIKKLFNNSVLPLSVNKDFVADPTVGGSVTTNGQDMMEQLKSHISENPNEPITVKVGKDENGKSEYQFMKQPLPIASIINPYINAQDIEKITLTHIPPTNKDKGKLGGTCYRTVCDNGVALYFNKSTKRHYCVECAMMINDAVRGDAYRLFGAELCELDESLTKKEIRRLENEYDTKYPTSPASDELSDASLKYKSNMDSFYQSKNASQYDFGDPTKEQLKNKDKIIPVTPKSLIGRNDPCSCGSGKKFKKCCITNIKMI